MNTYATGEKIVAAQMPLPKGLPGIRMPGEHPKEWILVKLFLYNQVNSAKYQLNRLLSRNTHKRIALIRHRHLISDAQVFPILSTTPSAIDFKSLDEFIEHLKKNQTHYDVVLIQCQWNTPPNWLIEKITEIRKLQKNTKVALLDWYAPLHIPHTEVIDHIDFYIKKQSFSNIEEYAGIYDTKLTEYEAQWKPEFLDTTHYRADVTQLKEKLIIGWNFATDRSRITQLNLELYKNKHRPIDIHCRIFAPKDRNSWYRHMRGRSFDAIQALKQHHGEKFNILSENKLIIYKKYLQELSRSKICLSPFGYGEVCWRDFEAIIGGALLLKPDMAHIQTNPDIFIPFETYIPIKWDYSDLEEKALEFLSNESERKRIAENAVYAWRSFLDEGWQSLWSDILRKMSLDEYGVSKLA
mgnify:CR=1 FL=1